MDAKLRNVKTTLEEAQGRTNFGQVGTFLCSPPATKVVTQYVSRSNSPFAGFESAGNTGLVSGKRGSRTHGQNSRLYLGRGRVRQGAIRPGCRYEPDAIHTESAERVVCRFEPIPTFQGPRGLDSARAPSDRRERPSGPHEGAVGDRRTRMRCGRGTFAPGRPPECSRRTSHYYILHLRQAKVREPVRGRVEASTSIWGVVV